MNNRRVRMHDPRSWGLVAVAIVCLSRGLAYTITDIPEKLPFGLDQLRPIQLYGLLWLAAGILAIWLATGRRDIWAVAIMTGMPTLWGLVYGLSWVVSGLDNRDWITMVLYLCLSVIVVSFGVSAPQKVVTPDGGSR